VRSHKVRTLFAKNRVRFARAEQLCFWGCFNSENTLTVIALVGQLVTGWSHP